MIGWRLLRNPMGPALAGLVLLDYVFAAAGNGLDRLAQHTPGVERLVPAPFRARTALAAASQAFAAQDGPAALRHARQAVHHDPVSGEALGKLGLAHLLNADGARASAAFTVAANTGWRDIPTQLYWYETALGAGNALVAAQRLDAILRTRPQYPEADLLLARLEATPDGRQALARQLAQRPKWLNRFMAPRPGMETQALRHRADVSTRIAALQTRLGCPAVVSLTRKLLDTGLDKEARTVWEQHCGPAGPADGLSDPDFRQLAQLGDAQPFGWRRHPSGDVTIRIEDGGAMTVANRDSVSRPLLSQVVHLAPGSYRVKIGVQDKGTSRTLAAALNCQGRLDRPSFSANADLVVGDCPKPLFSLWIASRTADTGLLSVRLEKRD